MAADASKRHVVFVGMMATGKSSVGKVLAERLGRPFFDSDDQIEAATGRTVREIWEAEGEAYYRELEAKALLDALDSAVPAVIAAAGGVVIDPANRDAIRRSGAMVVWLHAAPEALAARIGDSSHRPLIDDDPEDDLRRLNGERERLYRDLATLEFETSDLDSRGVEAIAAAVDDAMS